ncbi:hypothetical protein JCM19274_5329 [Algibacter lectus]|uniref:Right handed beta helix domain-containing protein n=1 Tax=Algibacter lectus TaxID=221126 RepID=A0A090WKU0_9FLAO|nr:hypothetical protein [Algibacter lectus]GAL77616.1 hypothetical protein JCM19274_5329 [Algibacter lectus]
MVYYLVGGIDVEAVRKAGVDYEIVKDVVIRNNIESGSENGAIIIFTGDDITIEKNTVENGLIFVHATGSIIRYNTVTAIKEKTKIYGTGIGSDVKAEGGANHSNQVYGNEVNDFATGINIIGINQTVYDNVVTNCINGIVLSTLEDSKFYGNTVKSNKKSSRGFSVSPSSKYLDNVIIGAGLDEANTDSNRNTIDVLGNGFRIEYTNDEIGQENFKVVVKNNKITSTDVTNFFLLQWC